MSEDESDWTVINQLLASLHSAYGTPAVLEGRAGAPEPDYEQALFVRLEPTIRRVAASLARRYRWPSALGDSQSAIADTLVAGTFYDLLIAFRHGKPPYLEQGYIWQVARNYGLRLATREHHRVPVVPLETTAGALEIRARQPSVDEIVAARDWQSVPAEVRERLAHVFNAPAGGIRARALRRRLLVLLHAPFITAAGIGAWGLAISSTELAGLVAAPIPTITGDRQVLASQLNLPTWDDPQAWFAATHIGSRLEILGEPARALLNHADHRATLRVLWPLLRLIQSDGKDQRFRLATAQGNAAALQWRVPGGAELLLSVEAYGLWAGDRVTLKGIVFPAEDRAAESEGKSI